MHPQHFKTGGGIFGFIVAVIILIILIFPRQRSAQFLIEAGTNILTISPIATENEPFVLRLPFSQILVEDENDFSVYPKDLVGVVSVASHGDFSVEMISQSKEKVFIRFFSNQNADDVDFRIYDETGLVSVNSDSAELLITCPEEGCNSSHTIRFFTDTKKVKLGETIRKWTEPNGSGSQPFFQPILESGKISAYDNAQLYNQRFLVDEIDLDTGDVANIHDENKLSFSANLAENKIGKFNVVVYVESKQIDIARFNGQTRFSVDSFALITKQPFLQVSWLSLVSVIIVIGFFLNLTDTVSRAPCCSQLFNRKKKQSQTLSQKKQPSTKKENESA